LKKVEEMARREAPNVNKAKGLRPKGKQPWLFLLPEPGLFF
jgi:hypothetical protein